MLRAPSWQSRARGGYTPVLLSSCLCRSRSPIKRTPWPAWLRRAMLRHAVLCCAVLWPMQLRRQSPQWWAKRRGSWWWAAWGRRVLSCGRCARVFAQPVHVHVRVQVQVQVRHVSGGPQCLGCRAVGSWKGQCNQCVHRWQCNCAGTGGRSVWPVRAEVQVQVQVQVQV